MSRNRKLLLAGIPVVIGALITAAAMIYAQRGSADSPSESTRIETTIGDDAGNGCVNFGAQGTVNCHGAPEKRQSPYGTEEEPSGPGPWGFRVYDTVVDGTDVGLTVRRCPERTCGCVDPHCEKLGIARQDSPLFAVCQFDSGFNGNDTSSVWLKVKWPNNRGGDRTTQVSSEQDPYFGWVLKKYTTPAGHNGNIRTCA